MFEFLRTKITPIILFFILSLFRSILGNKSVTRNFLPVVYRWMEHHRAIARSSSFLNGIASKNATNSRIVITRPRYPRIIDIREEGREGIHIYSHYSTKSSRSRATIRVIGIPRWEKCMLIQNARLYHDVLPLSLSLSLSKWKMERYAWTIAPHSMQIYIYIYTHVKVVSSDGKNLAQKWNWELVNYAEYSIETFDGGCGNTWRIFPLNFSLRLNLKRQNSRILLIYRRIRTWADFICFCLNERQGSWIEIQLFVDDKTRLEELSCGMI